MTSRPCRPRARREVALDDRTLQILARRSCHGDNAAFRELAGLLRGTLDWETRGLFAPGLEDDDLLQEGLIGLAQACEDYDPAKSGFRGFAALCIRRRVLTAVRMATRQKHGPLNDSIGLDAPVHADEGLTLADLVEDRRQRPPDEVLELRDELARISELGLTLSVLERAALVGVVDGRPYEEIAVAAGASVKAVDNALQRARRKASEVWSGEQPQQDDTPEEEAMTTETTAISAPVEALDEEIGRMEDKLGALRMLREEAAEVLEQVAIALNGSAPEAVKPPPAAKKPPSPPKPKSAKQVKASVTANRSPTAALERADEVVELLKRQGPMTIAEVARTTGWLKKSAKTACNRVLSDGRAHRTGERRGGGVGSPEIAVTTGADASPEPPAAASTTDDVAATSEVVEVGDEERNLDNSSDVSEQAEDLDVTEATARDDFDWPEDDPPATVPPRAAEPPDVEIQDYREPSKNRTTLDERSARLVEDAVRDEALTIKQIAEVTGIHWRRTQGIVIQLTRMRWLEQRGLARVDGQQKPKYRRRLRPAEDPSVTVTQADRTGSVESRVLHALEDGRLNMEQLAAKVVLHPRIVAEAVSELMREGTVGKIAGGLYELREPGRAAA